MKLIFVYNADSGLFQAVGDFVHKLASPKTYACNLCGLTYGLAFEKKEWQDFIAKSGYTVEFLHRDEFVKKYKNEEKLPAAFVEAEDGLKPFISADEINKCKSLRALIDLVSQRFTTLPENRRVMGRKKLKIS